MAGYTIGDVPLFAALPADEIAYLEGILNRRDMVAGEVYFVEGQLGDRFAIVLEGVVDIVKALGTPEERVIAQLGPGEFIGEMSLFYSDRQRSASARAGTNTALLEMTQSDFDGILSRQPALARRLLQALSVRMRNAEDLTIRDLKEKNRQLSEAYEELKQAQAQLIEKEKMAHELRMARRIQENILPKQVPNIPGWQINALWQPARQVSGDFYDFIDLGNQRLGVVVGDVTDKGMPAALVMAVTRSVLRFAALSQAAHDQLSPGDVLFEVNNILQPDMPQYMFVTCLYAVLHLDSGVIVYANAGHNLPYLCSRDGVSELRATGLPLGLLPGAFYEIKEGTLGLGERLVMYSDGLVEAHNPQGEMYGLPRLREGLAQAVHPPAAESEDQTARQMLSLLGDFTGAGWEQEDDITFLTVDRLAETPEA